MKLSDLWTWAQTDAAKLMLAGAAGGVVRWATLRSDWREGATGVVVGSLCALYLGPIVEPLLRPVVGTLAPHGDPAGFSAFVVGLGGIGLTAFIIEIIRGRRTPQDGDDDKA